MKLKTKYSPLITRKELPARKKIAAWLLQPIFSLTRDMQSHVIMSCFLIVFMTMIYNGLRRLNEHSVLS
jgi:hypothetical protein